MTPFPGVIRRADSTVWWFALRAPQDLLHRFDGGPWAARCSLKTRDLREANTKARVLQSEWAQRFDAMRREENPQRVELNPALVAAIAAEMRRWMLQADDNMRDFPGGPAALLNAERRRSVANGKLHETSQGLMIDVAEPEPISRRALTEDEQRIVAELNASEMAGAAIAMARRDRMSVLPLAEVVTKSIIIGVTVLHFRSVSEGDSSGSSCGLQSRSRSGEDISYLGVRLLGISE